MGPQVGAFPLSLPVARGSVLEQLVMLGWKEPLSQSSEPAQDEGLSRKMSGGGFRE